MATASKYIITFIARMQASSLVFKDLSLCPPSSPIHGDGNNETECTGTQRNKSLNTKVTLYDLCLFAFKLYILWYTYMQLPLYFLILFIQFYICFFLTPQLHIHDIISQCCIFLRWIPPWRWPKKIRDLLYDCIRLCLTVVQLLV